MGAGILPAHAGDWHCHGVGTRDLDALVMLAELDNIIALLEAELPCNPRSAANERLEESMFADVARYFRALRETFPYDAIDRIWYAHIREVGEKETADAFEPTLQAANATLQARMVKHWATIYVRGTAQVTKWAGLPYEGPPWERAITWAEKHGSQMITKLDVESKKQIAKVVSDGIKNKRGIEGIQRDIRGTFSKWGRDGEMPISRARMISRTESSNALSEAFIDRTKELGVEGKEIALGPNPCSICTGNAAVGVIGIDDTFPSGHTRTPFHTNCICALVPARVIRK